MGTGTGTGTGTGIGTGTSITIPGIDFYDKGYINSNTKSEMTRQEGKGYNLQIWTVGSGDINKDETNKYVEKFSQLIESIPRYNERFLVIYDITMHMFDRLSEYNYYYYLNKNDVLIVYSCIPVISQQSIDFLCKLQGINLNYMDQNVILANIPNAWFKLQVIPLSSNDNYYEKSDVYNTSFRTVSDFVEMLNDKKTLLNHPNNTIFVSQTALCYTSIKYGKINYAPIAPMLTHHSVIDYQRVYKQICKGNIKLLYLFMNSIHSFIVIKIGDSFTVIPENNMLEGSTRKILTPTFLCYTGSEYVTEKDIATYLRTNREYQKIFLYVHSHLKTHGDVVEEYKKLMNNNCMAPVVGEGVTIDDIVAEINGDSLHESKNRLRLQENRGKYSIDFMYYDFDDADVDADVDADADADVFKVIPVNQEIVSLTDFSDKFKKFRDEQGLDGKLCIGFRGITNNDNVTFPSDFLCGVDDSKIKSLYETIISDDIHELYFFDKTEPRYLVVKVEPMQGGLQGETEGGLQGGLEGETQGGLQRGLQWEKSLETISEKQNIKLKDRGIIWSDTEAVILKRTDINVATLSEKFGIPVDELVVFSQDGKTIFISPNDDDGSGLEEYFKDEYVIHTLLVINKGGLY
jgi:hypothetical protein